MNNIDNDMNTPADEEEKTESTNASDESAETDEIISEEDEKET